MKKYNLDFVFVCENGTNVVLSQDGDKTPLDLKAAAVQALLYASTDVAKKMSGREKQLRYQTAVLIRNFGADSVLSDEQVAVTKEAIGDLYIPVVVGQAWDILDGKEPQMFNLPPKAPEPHKA